MAEIGGAFGYGPRPLRAPTADLPEYLPKIHNGSARNKRLCVPFAVIPARELLSKCGDRVWCRVHTAAEVRSVFRLGRSTQFVISCVGFDEDVEAVWQGLRFGELGPQLARLEPCAVIVPNFSFFVDAPRPHILYNRKRICMAAEILSDAGCPVILPLLALTSRDWKFWQGVLSTNPAMRYVCEEFLTGLRSECEARAALSHLCALQEALRRPLRPVAIGALRLRPLLALRFK